jgi:hypothetical protein
MLDQLGYSITRVVCGEPDISSSLQVCPPSEELVLFAAPKLLGAGRDCVGIPLDKSLHVPMH